MKRRAYTSIMGDHKAMTTPMLLCATNSNKLELEYYYIIKEKSGKEVSYLPRGKNSCH